jgi:hypothetical protein
MNYDPVEVVIDQLIRNFRLREWQYDIEECVEDIAEAIKFIGAAKVYSEKTATLTVNQYLAPLPKDLQNIKHLLPVSMPYREVGPFIQVDVADGTEVTLLYQAMPMDSRGYILVPDSAPVRAAIMWYLVKVLILQQEIKHIGLDFADREWHWRCKSARGYLNAMSLQDVNKAYNDFVRLNPLKDVHLKQYLELGKPNTLDRTRNLDQFKTR